MHFQDHFSQQSTAPSSHSNSEYPNDFHGDMSASRAVDGDKTSNLYSVHSCSHTNDVRTMSSPVGEPNWLMVDLGQIIQITNVALTNRGDCCGK